MAILTGISGLQMGDGEGGKIALSIDTRVQRILANSSHAYKTATMMNAMDVKSGTVAYYKPEIVQAQDYGTGTGPFQVTNTGIVEVAIDTRRTIKWDWEQFDASRLHESEYIIGMISNGVANAILADLNAHFLTFVNNQLTNNTAIQNQVLVLPELVDETATADKCRDAMFKVQYKIAQLEKIFDKRMLGIEKAEMLVFLDNIADVNVRKSFTNIVGGINEFLMSDLKGVQLGNFKYLIDPMLNNKVPAGTSYSADKDLDTTNLIGFICHNEAIAMPLNYNSTTFLINNENANPRYISKYQFGIGLIRPKLLYGIVKQKTTGTKKP